MNEGLCISKWHICISGFLQSEGDPTGIVDLWLRMQGAYSTSTTRVELRSWCTNWSDMAELIWRTRPKDGAPIVCIYGYSWGGFSATLLASELKRRGIGVRVMVLCDAVYRHWYWLGQWRAFMPWSRIEVPSNVRHVFWFRQNNPRIKWGRSGGTFQPAGHEVVAADIRTTHIHKPEEISSEHAYADDWAAFHNRCFDAARAS